MTSRLIASALLVAALAGCAGPGILTPNGTVTGHVTVRTCGGAYRQGQNACSSRPLAGAHITFKLSGSQMTATTDSAGAYRISLRPGTYDVTADAQASMHVSGPRQISVSAGTTATADFTYTLQLL
jgi:hypothetical protein